jgi:hypothetical protein
MARKLRIAVSFFAVVTVLLCVQWVRSYWTTDGFVFELPRLRFAVGTSCGMLCVSEHQPNSDCGIKTFQEPVTPSVRNVIADVTSYRFGYVTRPGVEWAAMAPIEIPILIAAALSGLCWRIPQFGVCRFSLRTLLIATTLAAVVLGLEVWLAS